MARKLESLEIVSFIGCKYSDESQVWNKIKEPMSLKNLSMKYNFKLRCFEVYNIM